MTAGFEGRPTYVLGAGFSKAIAAQMPITHELGAALAERLGSDVGLDLQPGQTFEEWLTLQLTPLPFLEGHENARRAANGARVVAELARVVDEANATASANAAPLWLRQLVALWHAERAVVLTFNYDTLVERAVNGTTPTIISDGGLVTVVLGDHIVFPAPPAPQAQFLGDTGAGHTDQSFELLKMHGSLTWYWAAGDPTGSTLVRVREKHLFGTLMPLVSEADFSGATTLDRYLIPPITSKDAYYGSYLANALWRMARSRIASASSLTLIGYSLPPEDKVTSQLIAQVSADAEVSVVDRDPGAASPPRAVLGNLANLGIAARPYASGFDCIPIFVEQRLQTALKLLPQSAAFDEFKNLNVDVVLALSAEWADAGRRNIYLLVKEPGRQDLELLQVPYAALHGSAMPFREHVLNTMPAGFRQLQDFITASRMKRQIDSGVPLTFRLPGGDRKGVVIAASRRIIERWEVLHVEWAPIN